MSTGASQPRAQGPLLRSLVILLLASAGLLSYILGLGDFERQRYAVEQARGHAESYQRRVGEGGLLPLNLEPEAPPAGATQMILLEWPDHQAAATLRERRGRIIVARTVPITQVLRRDGRAVIYFENGRFDAVWTPTADFDAMLAAQNQSSE